MYLDNNDIGDEGANYIGEMIKQNNTIKIFDIGNILIIN